MSEATMRRQRVTVDITIEIDPDIVVTPEQVAAWVERMPAHYGWRVVDATAEIG